MYLGQYMYLKILYICNNLKFNEDLKRQLSREIESLSHFSHLFLAHSSRFESHALGINVDLSTLREHVNLIESIHHIQTLSKYAMFLPHHYIIILQLLQSLFSQFQTAW